MYKTMSKLNNPVGTQGRTCQHGQSPALAPAPRSRSRPRRPCVRMGVKVPQTPELTRPKSAEPVPKAISGSWQAARSLTNRVLSHHGATTHLQAVVELDGSKCHGERARETGVTRVSVRAARLGLSERSMRRGRWQMTRHGVVPTSG